MNGSGHARPGDGSRCRAVVVAGRALGAAVADELQTGLAGIAEIDVRTSIADAIRSVEEHPTSPVPLVVISSGLGPVDATIAALDRSPPLRAACTLLVTDRQEHTDVADAVDRLRLDAVVAIPWTSGTLGWHARSQVERWMRDRSSDDAPHRPPADSDPPRVGSPRSELLRDLELEPWQVTTRLVTAIERVLGPRPRLRLPAGTRLTHQDADVDGVVVVLAGSVALDRRTTVGDLRLHHGSTGPVIGLLSLAQQRQAFFTARTTTDVEVIHLSLEQLDRSLESEPEVGDALAAGAIRALARRLRRAEQLQVEKIELNRELDLERQRLSETLHLLEQARLDLVEQARFATLGELAAGIAHELNNPVAALSRATSYIAEDLTRVLASHPDGDVARRALVTARDRPPRSTADERAQRRQLEAALGDRVLVQRLHSAGIDDPAEARALVSRGDDAVELTEAAAGIGAAIHNLDVASRRIAELVASLRGFARPDSAPLDDIDLHAGIEDTIRLTAHRMGAIEIERRYGDLPGICGHPGQLSQVWTNLLVNAAEELDGSGHIEILTDVVDDEHIRVRMIDDGPGIDPDVLPRVFEPRFTTKQGTVRYGLGLGLAITRRIVEQHGGTIELDSRPGRTAATVTLPIAGPPEKDNP